MVDGDAQPDGPVELHDEFVCFAIGGLGVVASLAIAVWLLVQVQGLLLGVAIVSPVSLLLLVGRVVQQRALADWRRSCSKPLAIRLLRLFVIGFIWPVWLKQ